MRAPFVAAVVLYASPAAYAQFYEAVDGDEAQDAAFIGAVVAKPVSDKIDLIALGAYRTGETDFGVVNAGVKWNPNEHVSLAGGYFGLFQSSTSDRPDPRDHRIRLDGEIRRRFGSVTLQHRERFEYRFRDAGDGWRWRPEVRATLDTALFGRKVSPFLAVEPFYEVTDKEWTVILTQAGFSAPLGKGVAIQPAYIRATVLDGDDLNFYSLFFKYRLH